MASQVKAEAADPLEGLAGPTNIADGLMDLRKGINNSASRRGCGRIIHIGVSAVNGNPRPVGDSGGPAGQSAVMRSQE